MCWGESLIAAKSARLTDRRECWGGETPGRCVNYNEWFHLSLLSWKNRKGFVSIFFWAFNISDLFKEFCGPGRSTCKATALNTDRIVKWFRVHKLSNALTFSSIYLAVIWTSQQVSKLFIIHFVLKPNQTSLTNMAICVAEYNSYCFLTALVILCYNVTVPI